MVDFTPDEESLLSRSAPNTARLDTGRLQAYEQAYRPNGRFSYTRADLVAYEAITREINRRGWRKVTDGRNPDSYHWAP